jgi:DNA-binding transcriptional LysR family regulator
MRSPWARRRKVDLADLIDEPWILAAPDSWNYRIITEAFRARGFNIPRIRLATFSVHLRADMIASGECITTFPGFRGALFFGAISGEGATGRFARAAMANGYRDAEKAPS